MQFVIVIFIEANKYSSTAQRKKVQPVRKQTWTDIVNFGTNKK